MDMIGVVLSVVVLDEDGWAMHSIVVRFTRLETASPSKVQLVEARALDARELLSCSTLRHAIRVHVQELAQLRLLGLRHVACRKSFDVQRTYLWVVTRDDVRERVIGKNRAGASRLRQH